MFSIALPYNDNITNKKTVLCGETKFQLNMKDALVLNKQK